MLEVRFDDCGAMYLGTWLGHHRMGKAGLEREMRDVGMRRAGRARGARYELR